MTTPSDAAASGTGGAGALLGALFQAVTPLAPYLEPAVSAALAANPSPDEARVVLDGLAEVRDLIQQQIDRVAAYLTAKEESPSDAAPVAP